MKTQFMEHKSIGYKILHFPLTKIIIGFVLLVAIFVGSQMLISSVLNLTQINDEIAELIKHTGSSVIAIFAYILLFKIYERRKITELIGNRVLYNLWLGILIGAILQSLTIFAMYVNGSYSISSVNSFLYIIPALTISISSGIFEEILFRGVLFRILEEKLGSYIALIISALFFGFIHYLNPNSSFIAALGIAIQAGLLLGLVYMYTRSLWLPIGLHFAWNFFQSGIYGAKVSGITIEKSLFTSIIEGPSLITGGEFGPEGSIQATIFCLIASGIFLFLILKQHKIIKPFWRKPKPVIASVE
jgi:membrane protease YdiL (CAAX protease family)